MTTIDTTALRTKISSSSEDFPTGLHWVEYPPKQLYVVGDIANLKRPALAIVGARKATPYGLNCAAHFAKLAAAHDLVVVSGGAIGCDQAAHGGALAAGGRTVVVMGCGADVVYPSRAKKLFEQVLEQGGTIVSEAPWGSAPSRWSFRKRNRIIAGLAECTLIVEAGLPSGTFSTADATLSQGKEVLAIPGSIFAKESRGANRLIAQGAIPIVDDEAFIGAIRGVYGARIGFEQMLFEQTSAAPVANDAVADGCASLDPTQQRVVSFLQQNPLWAENLLGICGDDITQVIRYLSALEFAGLVCKLRDGRYALP